MPAAMWTPPPENNCGFLRVLGRICSSRRGDMQRIERPLFIFLPLAFVAGIRAAAEGRVISFRVQ
jgi:hypothetical protein